jgi:DNA/RNA-binding protein KIN17
MGKAEFGSTKHLSNQMKQKGLTRLRWFCSLCDRALRDENSFKQHTQSKSHLEKALDGGTRYKELEEENSQNFLRNFVNTLKTGHGEKTINANRFYQEIIADRFHVHLNSTKWHSLTDFIKYIAREGVCRVEEKEDGIFIAWIDDSPEATRRRETLRRKELQDKGDEEREQMLLQAQIQRAEKDARARGVDKADEADAYELKREEGQKISLSFGAKPLSKPESSTNISTSKDTPDGDKDIAKDGVQEPKAPAPDSNAGKGDSGDKAAEIPAGGPKPLSLKFGAKPATKNVFKNAFAGAPKKVMVAQPKKMSEAERIMKEELERKRARESSGGPNKKRRL